MEEARKILNYVLEVLKAEPQVYMVEKCFGDTGWNSFNFHRVPVEYPELLGLYRQINDIINVRISEGMAPGGPINPQWGVKALDDFFKGGAQTEEGLSGMSEEEIDERVKELWGRLYGQPAGKGGGNGK